MLYFNWTYSRLTKKILIVTIAILVSVKITSYYVEKYTIGTNFAIFSLSSRPLFLCLSNSTKKSSQIGIPCEQCQLSLRESDGWFCEFDEDWKRRKRIHYLQDKKNHFSDERELFFLNNWEPTIHCSSQSRLGSGDGGKWVCDIHKFKANDKLRTLVYSFGSNNNFDFEKAIKEELPESEIHTFDKNLFTCPANLCTFHRMYLGDGRDHVSKSLQMILNDLGHEKRHIHILKVDIEGSEFQLFEELFSPMNRSSYQNDNIPLKKLPYIRQILLEIHLKPNTSEIESRQAHKLFETFRHSNYAIFHKEANIYGCRDVFEYAFIRLNSKFFM